MGGNLSERIVEWSVPFRGRSMTAKPYSVRWTLFYSNGTAGRSVGFDFCTGNASGERFSVGGSLQRVLPFDGGMRTVAIGLVAGVSAAAEHYPVPNFEGSAVFALDVDPAAYPESSAGADRRVFDQSQAGFEDEFVGFSRAVVPGGQAALGHIEASRTASLRDCESPDAAVRSQTPP